MTSGARDMIGAVMGLIALLLALVLGTLVGSAYGFFATQKANVETLAARAIQLDMALKQFGPEAAAAARRPAGRGRAGLQGDLDRQSRPARLPDLPPRRRLRAAQRRRRATAGQDPGPDRGAADHQRQHRRHRADPAADGDADRQPDLLAADRVVVSWAMLLFAGYGVLARLNGTAVIAALIGAFAVGSALLPDPGTQPAVHRPVPHPRRRRWSRR